MDAKVDCTHRVTAVSDLAPRDLPRFILRRSTSTGCPHLNLLVTDSDGQ